MREADVIIERPEDAAAAELRAIGIEAAVLEPRPEPRRGVPGVRDEIDRAAERGGAVLQRIRAAIDLDVARGQRLDRLEVEAAIREVQRHAILQQLQAAAVEGALNAGAADGEARFLRAKARLDKDAGREIQRVLQRGGAAALVLFGIHDGGAAGLGGQLRAGLFDRGDGERAAVAVGGGRDRLQRRIAGRSRRARQRGGEAPHQPRGRQRGKSGVG